MKNLEFTTVAKGINLEAAGLKPTKEIGGSVEGTHGTISISKGVLEQVQEIMHTDSNDNLEKGAFADTFSYIEKYSFPVTKLGKDMKVSLEATLKYLNSEKDKCNKSIASLLAKCSVKPKSKMSQYLSRGLDAKMPNIPMMFTYKEIDVSVAENKESGMIYSTCPMQMYNDEVRRLASLSVDAIYAETMLEGINEDRQYTLSIKQAAQL